MYNGRVCVACLATDVRMYSMSLCSLLQPYQHLTGRLFQSDDGMPQKLCWECAALVNKFNLFRHKCERAHLLLQDLLKQHDEITESKMQQLNRKQHQLSSSIDLSETFTCSIEGKRKKKSRTKKLKQDLKFENVTVNERRDQIKTEIDVESEIDGVKFEDPVKEVSDDNIDCGSDISFEEKSKKPKHECELCSLEFRSALAFRKHKESSHGEDFCGPSKETNSDACSICGKIFKCAQSLREHQSVHTGVPNYTCEHCSLTFVYRRTFWTHTKTHVNTRAFVCDVCGKSFKTIQVFKDHRLTHRETRDFNCEVCPKTYTTYKALWLHTKKSHSNERPFVCDICNMSFSLKCELKKHIMKRKNPHKASSQSAFLCVICKKEFLTRGEFLTHKAACRILSATLDGSLQDATTEQKLRTYRCKMCSKSFTQYCSLTLHVNTTHSESRPYVCEVCGKAFKVKDGLKRHSLVHTGEKLYKCDLCEKSFASNSWLQQHIRRTHYNQPVPFKPRIKAKRSDRRAVGAVEIH